MKIHNSKTWLFSLVLFVVLPLLALPSSLDAQLGHRDRRCNRCSVGRNNCARCPQCNEEFCQLKCEETKEKKSCYEVDYKTVCIPKVNPPWKRNCPPQCAEARSVKVLKKKSYECPRCSYRWEVVKPQLPEIVDPQAPLSHRQQTPWQGAVPQRTLNQSSSQGVPAAESIAPIDPATRQRFQSVRQHWQKLDALKQLHQYQGSLVPAQPAGSITGTNIGDRLPEPQRQQIIQQQGFYQTKLGDQSTAATPIESQMSSAATITAAGKTRTAPQTLQAAGRSAAGANTSYRVPTGR